MKSLRQILASEGLVPVSEFRKEWLEKAEKALRGTFGRAKKLRQKDGFGLVWRKEDLRKKLRTHYYTDKFSRMVDETIKSLHPDLFLEMLPSTGDWVDNQDYYGVWVRFSDRSAERFREKAQKRDTNSRKEKESLASERQMIREMLNEIAHEYGDEYGWEYKPTADELLDTLFDENKHEPQFKISDKEIAEIAREISRGR